MKSRRMDSRCCRLARAMTATFFCLLPFFGIVAQDVPAIIDGDGTNRISVVSDFEFSTAVSGSARVVLERTTDDEITGGARTVALTGPNDSTGGMELWGSEARPLVVSITNVTTMPLSGGIDVYTNAALWLVSSDTLRSGSRTGSAITVHVGGSIVHPDGNAYSALGSNHRIILDGGRILLNEGRTLPPSDSVAKLRSILYLNMVTFKDGGTIDNGRPYLGGPGNVTWTIDGNTPISCPYGATLVGATTTKQDDRVVKFDVADVTSDDRVDFSIGLLRRDGSNSTYCPDKANATTMALQSNKVMVVKSGEGTMEYSAYNNIYIGPTRLDAGTLRLGANSTISSSYMLNMNGGSLSVAANCTNVIKRLMVSRSGKIMLETGSSLTIRAIDSWSASAQIVVDIPDREKCLRFATSTGVPILLTGAQLGAMRTSSGRRVVQDEDGWVLASSRGFIIKFM